MRYTALRHRLFSTVRACQFCLVALALCVCLANGLTNVCSCAEPIRISFADVTSDSQIDFLHRDGSSGQHYLVEVVAAGLASFDYDRDGRVDCYFLNGAELKGTDYDSPPTNELFRNLSVLGGSQLEFSNATSGARLGDFGFGLGVTVGDYDNDGFQDVYVTNFGPNVMYRNNGDGTFTKVVDSPDLACGDKVGGGACMLDMDCDGDLDLFAASYIDFDYAIPPSTFRERIVYGGPLLYSKLPDDLLRNDGSGGFENVTREAGISGASEWGMGTICFDYDADGDTDIFVANDSTRNLLWNNDGQGHFSESALLSGIAYDHRGDPQGSMGVDVADVDGDQWLDLYQTAYTKQLATLYQNVGGVLFNDATRVFGAGAGTFYAVNWGTALADFDNDGDKDLFIANGHIHDNMDDLDDTVSYKLRNQVFENRGGTKFLDVSSTAGSGLLPKESSRGLVAEDFNLDGMIDLIVMNSRTLPTVMKNESENPGAWVALDLIGTVTNRDAVGSRVVVTTQGRSQVLEVHSGRGYQSHFGSRLHFGLGDAKRIDQLEIYWHSGRREVHRNLPINTLLLFREGHQPVWKEMNP